MMLPYLLSSEHRKEVSHKRSVDITSRHSKYHVARYTQLQVTVIKSPIWAKITLTKLTVNKFLDSYNKGAGISTDSIYLHDQFVRMAAVRDCKDYATVVSSFFQVSSNFHVWQLLLLLTQLTHSYSCTRNFRGKFTHTVLYLQLLVGLYTHALHLKCTYLHFCGCILLLFVFRLWRWWRASVVVFILRFWFMVTFRGWWSWSVKYKGLYPRNCHSITQKSHLNTFGNSGSDLGDHNQKLET